MELHHKVYILRDKDNNPVDLEKINDEGGKIGILINGANNGSLVKDVFKVFEFEEDKIVGYSILEYFKVVDGKLLDEDGNKVNFINLENRQELFVSKIRNAWIMGNDKQVNTEYVTIVSKILQMKSIEKVIPDLTDDEKQEFQNEREQELKISEQKAAQQEAERLAKEQEEKERQEAERLAKEQQAAQQEAERIAKEQEELAAKAKEQETAQQEAERLAKEAEELAAKAKLEQEEKERQEAERIAKEQEELAAKAKLEQEEKERQEAERIAKEQEELAAKEEAKKKMLEEFEITKQNFIDLGYDEYEQDNYFFLYKADDVPYLVKLMEDDYDQLDIEEAENKDGVIKYTFIEDGKSRSFIFDSVKEEFSLEEEPQAQE